MESVPQASAEGRLSKLILTSQVGSPTGELGKSDRRKFKLTNVGISINDLWIASIALQHNLTVVSADQDFTRMREAQEFRLEAWHTQ